MRGALRLDVRCARVAPGAYGQDMISTRNTHLSNRASFVSPLVRLVDRFAMWLDGKARVEMEPDGAGDPLAGLTPAEYFLMTDRVRPYGMAVMEEWR